MKENIFICAKTYPNLSISHTEVMCSAGLDQSGNWKRIYPINYRELTKDKKFKKYQWIKCDIIKDLKDPRVESYKISDDWSLGEIIDTKDLWLRRKDIVNRAIIYSNIKAMIAETKINKSLFTFKPSKILDCIIHIDYLNDNLKKRELFMNSGYNNLLRNIRYKIYYKFIDDSNNISKLQIIDWEIYQLINKLICKYEEDDIKIATSIKQQYMENIALNKDVYLFLGTNKYWHIRRSANPLMIIGIFYPPFPHKELE